jgi:hypothetical protein
MNTKELFYQRFVAKNDSVCNISEVNDEEISYYGEGIQLQTKSKLKESDLVALEIANDAVLNRVSKKGKKVSHEINDPKAKGATAAKGTISRIVHKIDGPATDPRGDVQYVVTEYGAVNLRGKSTAERTLALIGIAHPKFRDELLKQAQDLGYV